MERPQEAYRPGVIGGVIGHVVGFPTVRPPTEDPPLTGTDSPFRFPENYSNMNRRDKKSQQTNKSTSIIGSFVDLLFN